MYFIVIINQSQNQATRLEMTKKQCKQRNLNKKSHLLINSVNLFFHNKYFMYINNFAIFTNKLQYFLGNNFIIFTRILYSQQFVF